MSEEEVDYSGEVSAIRRYISDLESVVENLTEATVGKEDAAYEQGWRDAVASVKRQLDSQIDTVSRDLIRVSGLFSRKRRFALSQVFYALSHAMNALHTEPHSWSRRDY